MDKPELRAGAPHQGGPLGSSGAAPEANPDESTKPANPAAAETSSTPANPAPANPAPANPVPASPAPARDVAPKPEDPAAPASAKDETPAAPAAEDKVAAAPEDKSGTPAAEKSAAEAAPAASPSGQKTAEADGASPAPAPARRLRRAHPVRVAKRAGRSTSEWAKRPSGRLILPGVIAILLLGAAGTAGAYLVPKALQAAPSPSATPGFPLDATVSGVPGSFPAELSTGSAPSGAANQPVTTAPVQQVQNGVRPADALAGWAQQVGTKVGIPVVAVQAYGYAELVLTRTMPGCHLSWTTIAAIASVESAHGSANGAVLAVDGSVSPPIYGLPLDGKGGRQLIADSDQGTIDGDTTYDRAVGPLQFIPSTWNQYKVDADNNGVADPNDIDDASLTAATYLCQGGRDLSKAESWWDAILSYNAVQPYAQKVFEAANDYGQRSRS